MQHEPFAAPIVLRLGPAEVTVTVIHSLIVSGLLIGKMAFLLVLSFLPMALPVAFLIGILAGFGRLSADSELVAFSVN